MDIFKTLLIHNPPNLALEGQVSYQGTWDASANSPTLVSGIGTKGYYYVVSTSGSTNLDGVTTWTVGDWAIFNGTAWQKVDNTDAVNSVFGRTGAVVGVSTDYSSVGITNTAIGASNPSTGAFTTLSATGNLTASGGSITVSGGAYPNFYANGTTGGGFTIQKSGVSYGTFYGNDSNTVLDSAGSASLILQTGGATRATLTSTATTLAGNLTVSGTGTSSFESTTPPTVAVQNTTSGLAGTQTGANGVLLGTLKFGHPSDAQSGNFPSIVGRFSLTDASFARCTALDFYTSSASGNARVGTFTELGNLLIGTTTDSANGKIQLTSHTTSAGGIGFGTDTSLFRSSAGRLALNGASAGVLYFYEGGSEKGYIGTASSVLYVGSTGAANVLLQTNSTTALTLDSSQNATFAGTASLSTTTDRAGLTINFPVGATGSNGPAVTFKTWTNSATLINAGRIASIITDGLASYASKLEFSVANAGSLTTALTIESNSNATFAGSIKTVAPTGGTAKFWELGEAATVSPTSPNRTIRVEIDGTVYYIHAKTTND